jgi:hypothetical protein
MVDELQFTEDLREAMAFKEQNPQAGVLVALEPHEGFGSVFWADPGFASFGRGTQGLLCGCPRSELLRRFRISNSYCPTLEFPV